VRSFFSGPFGAPLGSAALCVLLSASGALAQEVGTAARVNGVEISVFRLERYFEDYLQEKGRSVQMMTNPQVYKRLKREALDQLIEAELLWQEAKKKKVAAAPEEVRAAMERLRALVGSEEALRRKLDNAGFTEATYLDYLKRALSTQLYIEREVTAAVSVSDQAVHDFYAGNPDKFVRPGQAGPVPEAEASARIREYLLAVERQKAVKDALEALRSKAKIEILVPL
jgi:SurA-like protein